MIKEFLKEGGIYTIANLLTKGVSLMLIPFYTAYFTPEDYGVLEIISIFGGLFGVIFTFQIHQGLGKFVGEDIDNIASRVSIASTALIFIIISLGIGLIISFSFQYQILLILKLEKETLYTLQLALGSLFMSGLFYHQGTLLRSLRMTKWFASLSIVHSLLSISLTILFVLFFNQGINGVFLAALISSPSVVAIQAFVLKDEYRFNFNSKTFKKLFKFSYPLIPAALAYIFLNLTDRIFINDYLTKDDLGVYAIGSKFSSVISLVVFGFSSAMAPLFYQKYKDEAIKTDVSILFDTFWAIGLTVVFLLSIFSKETLMVFTQPEFYGASLIMPILYFSVLISGLGMFGPGLHLFARTKTVALIVILTSLLNIVLNYLFITKFQLIGAASSTLICSILNFGTLFIASRKYYTFKINYRKIFTIIIMIALSGISLFLIKYYLILNFWEMVLVKTLLFFVLLVMFIKHKLIDLKLLRSKLSN